MVVRDEGARHKSTKAGELFWQQIFEGVPAMGIGTEWDLFHRLDIACRRSIAAVPAALEVFDVCKIMGALFGVGDGRAV